MRITVVGIGYVGLSVASLLSEKHEVIALDIVQDKVDKINNRIVPFKDEYIEKYFIEKKLNLEATTDYEYALKNADYVIICTPTNYDENTNKFDTSMVEDVLNKIIKVNKNTTVVIKSTIPVGFTDIVKEKYKLKNVFFAPEFLREGSALYDNLYPSRIIIGDNSLEAHTFANLLLDSALKKDIPVLYMSSKEAEAVKLFANTYLALRISYFNELDTYAEIKGLNTKNIIDGVCLDPRIGNYYNNPSFGYGGYCLPKDTKQLLFDYEDVPQNMVGAIVKAHDTRKKHIAAMILKKKPQVVGIYRLTMKANSDNFRFSAVKSVMDELKSKNVNIMIYEPNIKVNTYEGFEVVHDLKLFKEVCDLVIANRIDKGLDDCRDRIYSRDIFYRD